MESLRNGVTTVVDDVYELGGQSMDQLAQVFQAYDDVGMRANVSGHIMDRPFLDTIPVRPRDAARRPAGQGRRPRHARTERLSRVLQGSRFPLPRSLRTPALYDRAVGAAALHRTADVGRRRVGAVDRLAVPYPYPGNQDAGGDRPEFHGKTLIRYMHDLGLLHSGTTIAHSIW